MAFAPTFKCTRCGEECEFRAANFADSGLCDECYAAQPDVGPCECCGVLSDSRAFATPDDWNSPLWCASCRADDGAAQPPCSYCDAPITDGGGPYCDECLGRFYGRRPCVACGVSVAGWPTACPSCGSEAWTGDSGGAA